MKIFSPKYNSIYNFLLLSFVLAGGLLLIYLNVGFSLKQSLIIYFMAIFYFLWGIIHHYLEGDLQLKIVVEYLLVALVFVVLLRGAFIR